MTLDLTTHDGQAAHYGAIKARFYAGGGVQDRTAFADHTVREGPGISSLPSRINRNVMSDKKRDWLLVASKLVLRRTVSNVELVDKTWREIVDITCEQYGVPSRHLLGRPSDRLVVSARHKAIERVFIFTALTRAEIARAFGRDHTVIRYVLEKANITDADRYLPFERER